MSNVELRPVADVPDPGRFRRSLSSTAARVVASLLLALGSAVYLRQAGLELAPDWEDFGDVRWWAIVFCLPVSCALQLVRALRWRGLLRSAAELPLLKVVSAAFVGYLAVLIMPFRMGEFVRPTLIAERGRVTFSQAMATIAAERILDGLLVASLLGGALAVVPRPALDGVRLGHFAISRLPQLALFAVLMFAAASVALALFAWKRALAERLVHSVLGLFSLRLASSVSRAVAAAAGSLRSILSGRMLLPFLGYSLLYWGGNALMFWLLGWACGLPITLGSALAVLGVLSLGVVVPAGPGLLGSFQIAVYAALLMYIPEAIVEREGSLFVFLLYAVQFAMHVATGLPPLLLGRRATRAARAESAAASSAG